MDWCAIASILAERSDRPISLLDKQGRIRLFNHAMEEILGRKRFQVEGQLWADACTPIDQREAARRWIAEAMRGALRSYDAIGLVHSGARVAFRFEFSLVGRGALQGLLMTAIEVIPIQGPSFGTLEGQELDYEVATESSKFGALSRIVANGEALPLSHADVRCFNIIHGLQQPCEECPLLLEDDSPRISVRPGLSAVSKTFEVRTAEKISGGTGRVRLRLLSESELDAVHAAKVDALAKRADLSPREREVLTYLLLGRNVDDIAQLVGIAVRTVKYHQANVLAKLGADSRADLMRLLF